MSKNAKKIIVANWKMNPNSLFEAKKIFNTLKKIKVNNQKTFPIICPPFVFLESLAKQYRGSNLNMGSQDIAPESSNHEMTGEISATMLKDMNVKFSIVGHSERRAMGETDELISKKIHNALKNKITPIVCVGEKERDVEANFLRALEKQIRESLANLSKDQIKKIIIAYEPVWAVGEKGHVIDVHDLNQTVLFIRKILVNMTDRNIGLNLPILYGGSVDAENLPHIFSADIQGVLVGRASVNPFEFAKILKQ